MGAQQTTPRERGTNGDPVDGDGASVISMQAAMSGQPSSMPIQPMPRFALTSHTPDGEWTAITRRFEDGQAAHCRLCPKGTCCAVQDVCLILVNQRVEESQAPLFSAVGIPRVGRG